MKIRNNILKNITSLYILLPVIIFMLGWLRTALALPLTIICIWITFIHIKKNMTDTEYFKLSKKAFIISLFIAFIWVFLSGIGKLVSQPTEALDHPIRNSIYHDMIFQKWPVLYDTNTYLCYYIGHWLFPSFISKIFFFITDNEKITFFIGNIILYLWSTLGIELLFIWICKTLHTYSAKKVLLVLTLFITFSGLDIIGLYILNLNFNFSNVLFNDLEWWSINWQYSSFTSLLFWVYNQMIVPMLITIVLLNETDNQNKILFLSTGLLFGPYPILGLGLYLITMDILTIARDLSLKNLKSYFSMQNMLSLVFILPVIVLFFMANFKIANNTSSMSFITAEFDIYRYILFI